MIFTTLRRPSASEIVIGIIRQRWHRQPEHVRQNVTNFVNAFSGDGARLFISLLYFFLIANTLTIADFGLFATASSVGVVLSRVAAFGFLSPLYRIATVKPQLIGAYAGGFLVLFALSVPLIMALGALAWAVLFSEAIPVAAFALIVLAEVAFWRPLEAVINVNKGMNRFGRASVAIVTGFAMKAAGAAVFAFSGAHDLMTWAIIYAAATGLGFAVAAILFWPRQRIRLRPALYRRRMPDSISVMGAEVLFYVQMELDKLVVLTIGGAEAAGIYAIIMRLVDLTAMPVRTFSTLLSQRLMRDPQLLASVRMRAVLELTVFAVSTAAIVVIGGLLWLRPTLLGNNVAAAAPFVIAVLLVPAFRNLIEYQAELLYGRGQSFIRAINYALIGSAKAVLLVWVFRQWPDAADWSINLNFVFATLYAISFVLTYTALRRPAVRV